MNDAIGRRPQFLLIVADLPKENGQHVAVRQLAKRLTELLGGEMLIESHPNVGTTVRVSFSCG